MAFDVDRARRHTDRIAELLADERGGQVLAELQKLLLTTVPRPPAAEAVRRPDDADALGPWTAAREPAGVALRRQALPSAEARFWSQAGDVAAPGDARRVVLLGESTARGFLLDPVLTPAALLEHALAADAGEGAHQCVDLARTGASLEEIEQLVERLPLLEPDVVVLMAGNNWAHPRYTPGALDVLGRSLRAGGYELLQETFWRAVVLPRARRLLARLGRLREAGADVVVVVPEFNLAEWAPEPGFEAPIVRDADHTRWTRRREDAAALLAGERWEDLLAVAAELELLDRGLSPVGPYLRGRALLALGRTDEARSALERSRDAGCGLLVSHSPRCPGRLQELLAAGAAEMGAACVDLREVLRSTSSPLPDETAFLDYCHLSAEGQVRATRAIADAVLGREAGGPPAAPPIGAEEHAVSHLLAAVHNAYSGQPPATLERHLARARALAPAADADLRRLRSFVAGAVPAWASPAFNELCRRPNARRYLAANVEGRVYGFESLARRSLRDALARVLGEPQARPEVVPTQDLLHASVTGTSVRERAGVTYEDERGYVQAAAPCSRFRVDGAPSGGFGVELVLRVPAADAGAEVEVAVNGQPVGAVACSARWSRAALEIGAGLLAEENVLELRWPPPAPQYERRRDADAAALARGDFPGVLPVTGEIWRLRATPLRAGA